jgi:hypothetical protein
MADDPALIDAAATAGANPRHGLTLDWSNKGPQGAGSAGPPRPCTLCGRPAICRSPAGAVIHKVCAEAYLVAKQQQQREAA